MRSYHCFPVQNWKQSCLQIAIVTFINPLFVHLLLCIEHSTHALSETNPNNLNTVYPLLLMHPE